MIDTKPQIKAAQKISDSTITKKKKQTKMAGYIIFKLHKIKDKKKILFLKLSPDSFKKEYICAKI